MKYPFRAYPVKSENHRFWVAESKLLKGCVAQGETAEEAIKTLEINEAEWLETAAKYEIPIPEETATEIESFAMLQEALDEYHCMVEEGILIPRKNNVQNMYTPIEVRSNMTS